MKDKYLLRLPAIIFIGYTVNLQHLHVNVIFVHAPYASHATHNTSPD